MLRMPDSNPNAEKPNQADKNKEDVFENNTLHNTDKNMPLSDVQKLVSFEKHWGSDTPKNVPDNDPDIILRDISQNAIPYLRYAIMEDDQASPLVKVASLRSLSYISSNLTELEPVLISALLSNIALVVQEAARICANFESMSDDIIKVLIGILNSYKTNWITRTYIWKALAKITQELDYHLKDLFLMHLKHDHPAVRFSTLGVIGKLRFKHVTNNWLNSPESEYDLVIDMTEYDIRIVSIAAAFALGRIISTSSETYQHVLALRTLKNCLLTEIRYQRGLYLLGLDPGSIDLDSVTRTGSPLEPLSQRSTASSHLGEIISGPGIDIILNAMRMLSKEAYSEGMELVLNQSNNTLSQSIEALRQRYLKGHVKVIFNTRDPRASNANIAKILNKSPQLARFFNYFDILESLYFKFDRSSYCKISPHKCKAIQLCNIFQNIAQEAKALSKNNFEIAASESIFAITRFLIEDIQCSGSSSFWNYCEIDPLIANQTQFY